MSSFQVMIHVAYNKVGFLLSSLYGAKVLDSFYVIIKPPFTACSSEENGVEKVPTSPLCVMFDYRGDSGKVLQHKIALIMELLKRSPETSVTLKEGNYGMGIGKVWELDDGMC